MADPASLERHLATAPTVSIKMVLARRVSAAMLYGQAPPDFLFTSGKRNRYNLAGVSCVYFSESEEVAMEEYSNGLSSEDRDQPVTTYWAVADIGKVLDLTNPATLVHIGLTASDIRQPWLKIGKPVATQLLGAAVATNTSGIAAIRYPSEAMRLMGRTGTNFVIFRDRVVAPDSLAIKGPGNTILQRWP